jgi:hypothetical protein
MLTEHGLDHNKWLTAVKKLLLRYDSLLLGHHNKMGKSIKTLCANVNQTQAKLTQDLPDIHQELQTTAQGLAMAICELDTLVQEVLASGGMASAPNNAGACDNTGSVPHDAGPSNAAPNDPTKTPPPSRVIRFPMADDFSPSSWATSFPSGN